MDEAYTAKRAAFFRAVQLLAIHGRNGTADDVLDGYDLVHEAIKNLIRSTPGDQEQRVHQYTLLDQEADWLEIEINRAFDKVFNREDITRTKPMIDAYQEP